MVKLWKSIGDYVPVVPPGQATVDYVFGVPDGGEVGEAVHPVTLGVAGPGHQQEPRLPALPTPSTSTSRLSGV